MNWITTFITQSSSRGCVPEFTSGTPLTAGTNARSPTGEAFETNVDFGAHTAIPLRGGPSPSKPIRTWCDAWGLILVLGCVLGVGTAWACIIARLLVMAAQMEPLMIHNGLSGAVSF